MMTDDSPDMPPTPAEQVQLLFVRHEGAIRAFVRALQPSLADADDVLQETFLTVSRKASSFEPGTNFVAWACGIARLKVLESFRQRKRANVLSEAALIALAEEAPAAEMTGLREEALGLCIEKLAPKSRDLVVRAIFFENESAPRNSRDRSLFMGGCSEAPVVREAVSPSCHATVARGYDCRSRRVAAGQAAREIRFTLPGRADDDGRLAAHTCRNTSRGRRRASH